MAKFAWIKNWRIALAVFGSAAVCVVAIVWQVADHGCNLSLAPTNFGLKCGAPESAGAVVDSAHGEDSEPVETQQGATQTSRSTGGTGDSPGRGAGETTDPTG